MSKQIKQLDREGGTLPWREQNDIGREKARALIIEMKFTGNPTLLGHRVKEMIESGGYTGVSVGFFAEIASRLV